MPFYPGASEYLTDEQCWATVCADPAVTNAELAAPLGVLVGTVMTARWRLRTKGWTCRVSYGVCTYCGKPFTRQGASRLRLAYYPVCRPLAHRMNRRVPDRRRREALPVEERRVHLARANAFNAEHQAATKARATQHQARWTEAEDAVLIARQHEPAHVLAYELRRSLSSVRHRRGRLRAKGLLP